MGLLKLSLWLQVENNKIIIIKILKKLTKKEKKNKMQSQIMLFKKNKNSSCILICIKISC